ncbi:hypothetical protein IAG44_05950 [Streptomyces roseirectus]|uniref:Core-binding (CB) domain-containing protein n=1 Tax=Streptomyces roseirectus TaxID=2768066 RepID=A0A7H0I8B4_9ACTN|nr:hypothetical protein IAG44_05950 [Streptomyces roseirectus]
MRTSAGRGRIYRRCGCRDPQHHQLGARCPRLTTDSGHGTWTFAVDLPNPGPHRTTVRRGGFPTHDLAEQALTRFLDGQAGGCNADPAQTVADYLTTWLATKALVLKPTTMARYRDCVRNDLVPAFGTLKLDQLAHRHISAYVTRQLAAGRGRVTLYRCLATLSSALGDAVREHRLPHNPASPPSCHARHHRNAGSGPPKRQHGSSPTATRPTRRWPTCSSSSSAPACAKAKRWGCTGTTSTSRRASSTCAAPSPPSTTTASSSPLRRPAPAAPGSRSHPASPPPSTVRHNDLPVPAVTPVIPSPDSCSAAPTDAPSHPTTSSTGSTSSPTKPASPRSPSTTCATSQPPSPSAQASR